MAMSLAMPLASTMAELDVGALYHDHGAFVGRIIERLVGLGPHVDDLLQETFIVAFKQRKKFDPERAAPTTWLYGIASNLCRRHLRGRQRFDLFKNRLQAEPLDNPNLPPDVVLEKDEAAWMVFQALSKLPLKQREVFALYELEELDGPTIAEMIGIPVGTVWTRLHHARRKFEKHLKTRLAQEVSV